MTIRRLMVAAVVVAGTFSTAGRANAQCGLGSYGYGYGAWDVGRLYGVLADRVPYYAAFPPVYYSYPVARSYGYSPFAYPPGVMTPEVEVAEPLAISNPYYKGDANGAAEAGPAEAGTVKAGAATGGDQTTAVSGDPKPLMVVNPFVPQRGMLAGR